MSSLTTTSPLGLRTAMARAWGDRIMTPSITACPPTAILAMASHALRPYFFWNLSTRPAESTSFCFPVKKGWQREQISTEISFLIDLVRIWLPQAHLITESTNLG